MVTIKVFLAFALPTAAAFSSSSSPERIQQTPIPSLKASQFRHPLDKELTSTVQRLPFYDLAEEGLRNTFPLVEQTVKLDLLSNSVKISESQFPEVYNLLVKACDILNLPKDSIPELYLQSSPQANAYTLALQGKTAPSVIVITSALVDRCTLPELQAVIGHELGHLVCEHSLYLTLGGLASQPLRNLPFFGSQVDVALQDWRLAAEYTCDRASLLVAQDVQVVAGALLKLFAGTSKYNLDAKSFVQQAVDYERQLKSANPLVRMSIEQQRRTHPLPVKRVAELEKWAQSDEYLRLVPTAAASS